MSTTNAMITAVLDYTVNQNPTLWLGVDRGAVEAALQASFEALVPELLSLDGDKPDAEAILLRLVQDVQQRGVWKDVVPAATGQTLLRNMAAGISQMLYAVGRALQETNSATAQSRRSLYAIAAGRGVRVRRRTPARVDVSLSVPDHKGTFEIPRFTQFRIGDQSYFNREAVVFSEYDLVRTTQLCQGVVYTMSGTAQGLAYERIEVGFENYLISEQDVVVWVNNREQPRVDGLEPWRATVAGPGFFERPLENGNVEIKFGSGAYLRRLVTGETIRIVWAETQGRDAAIVPATSEFLLTTLPLNVTGRVLPGWYPGDNEPDLEFYRTMTPHLGASRGNGIRRSDIRGVATSYPNVVDAVVRGQAELNPSKRSWMNIIGLTVLTRDGISLTATQWKDFVEYVEVESQESFEFIRLDPALIRVKASLKVFCRPRTNLTTTKTLVASVLAERFRPRLGTINYTVYNSDVTDALRENETLRQAIEYVDDLSYTYAVPPGFTQDQYTATFPPGAGIVGDEVRAVGYSAVVFDAIDAVTDYTTRRTYQGRKELA